MASELDDLDVTEQVEPVISATLGTSLASLVPGATAVASVLTNAMLDGTANAYLTLRVGIIARIACSPLTTFDQRSARRAATLAAARLLGSITSAAAARVGKAILSAARKSTTAGLASVTTAARQAGERLNPFRTTEK